MVELGLTPWHPRDRTAFGLTAQAQLAESAGYQSFWLPENHFNEDAIPDPLMLLAAVAAGTTTIRLATTSYLLPLRHPIQAAEQVAVLDQLSNGRVILGVGRGYAAPMLKAFDVVPREKRSLFESRLQCMLQAWSGAPLGEGGEADVMVHPRPVQRPHPPVWVAAFGPKALEQAGRLGLPYLASPVETLDMLVANYSRHRAALAAAGCADPGVVPIMRTLFVTDSAAETAAVREVLADQARRLGRLPEDTDVEGWSVVGEAGYVLERVAEYRSRLGMTHLIVARPRFGGVDADRLARSMTRAAEILRT